MAKKPDIIGSIDINGRFTSGQTMPTQKITKTPALSAVSSSKAKPVQQTVQVQNFQASRQPLSYTAQQPVQQTVSQPVVKKKTKEEEEYEKKQKNLKIAENDLNVSTRNYQKALSNAYQKNNVDFRTDFVNPTQNMISYQTKEQDKIKSTPELQTEAIQKSREEANPEWLKRKEDYEKWKIANYENNIAKVNQEESTLFDKTLGTPIRAIGDLLSPLTIGEDMIIRDEEGNKTFLPSYNELKQQKVREDTTGLGGVLMDIGYNTTKIAGAGALDAVTGGIGGKALYWTDMATDNFKNIKNQGYDNKQAVLNTIISTGSEYITEKVLGGLAGQLTGGGASEVQNIFSNVVNKLIKKPKVANVIGSMGSEGLEEFVQEFIGAVNDKITLGQDTDIVQLIQDAFYSGIIGAGSAGLSTATNNIEGRVTQENTEGLQKSIDYLKQQRETASEKNVKKIDTAISEAQKYVDKPFTEDYEKAEESVNKTLQSLARDVDNTQKQVYNDSEVAPKQATYKEIKNNTVQATIAPYYNTPLTKENYNEVKEKVDTSFKDTAESITSLLGGKIKDVSNNIGGFTFEEGQNAGQFVNELSYTFDLENVSREDAQLMSSLMGDLGYEQQEAVISATYSPLESSNALEYRVSFKNLDNIMGALKEAGIDNYTIDEKNNTLKLLEFDLDNPEATAKKIADLYELLGDDVFDAEYSGVQSDYITKSDRERIYKTWLDTNKGSTENRELRSLVEDAYKKITEGTSDSSFSNVKETEGPALSEAPKAEKNVTEVAKESFKTKKETVKEEKTTVKSKEFKEAINKIREGTATEKERRFVRTAVEVQNTQELVKDMKDVQKNYTPISNEDTLNRAESQLKGMKISEKATYVRGLFTSGKRITATDMAAAELVLKDVAATKNAKLYTDTLADFAALSTEYGQVIQAISMIKKLSPTYQLDVLEKMINREVAKGNKKYRDVKVTQQMRDRILNCYDDNGNLNQQQFDETMESIKQELADKIKVGVGEKVRAWRYLSMLGNPKTHVRNEVANFAMTAVKSIKDTISAGAQDLFIKEENKTRTLKSSSKEVKNFASTTFNELSEDISGNKYNEKTDLEDKTRIFKTRWLEALRKFNDKALSKEDQGFKKINFKKTFANYLTAHGIETAQDIKNNPQIVQKAKLFAMEEANVATFNQQNKLAEFINSGDKKLGPAYRFVRGAIIPFTRTPLNIAKTGIEYTPGVGLLTTIADVQKAPNNMKATVLVDSLSKQVVGTSLALLGYALAKGGLVTAGTDDDKEGKFLKDQGTKMDFSFKWGDTSYDLSWLSPSSMPFFVGAKMFEVLEKQEGINENIVLESLASTLDPLSEMSCISSFTKVLNSYSQEGAGKLKDIGVSTAQNYLSQFVPTLLGQFARWFDPYKRTTSADIDAPNKISQETLRTLAYKFPGARNFLPETTDYLGRTKKEDENFFIRGFNALINPANTRKDTLTEEGKEILRLYEQTGDDSIIPAALTQNVKYDGRDHKMTRKEYNEYKKDFGDAFEDNVRALMRTTDYKKASDSEKADMISGIMGYAKDKTKDNFLTERGEDYEKTLKDGSKSPYESDKVDMLTNKDFSIADYYVYKAYAPSVIKGKYKDVQNRLNVINTFGIDKEVYQKYMDEIGQISGKDRKQKIFEYINSLPLTAQQKKLLMKKQYTSYRNYDKEFFNVINNSDLTLEEKESLKNFLKIGK